jgi:hypothetical protein
MIRLASFDFTIFWENYGPNMLKFSKNQLNWKSCNDQCNQNLSHCQLLDSNLANNIPKSSIVSYYKETTYLHMCDINCIFIINIHDMLKNPIFKNPFVKDFF